MFNVSVGATSQKDIDNIYIKKCLIAEYSVKCYIILTMLQ